MQYEIEQKTLFERRCWEVWELFMLIVTSWILENCHVWNYSYYESIHSQKKKRYKQCKNIKKTNPAIRKTNVLGTYHDQKSDEFTATSVIGRIVTYCSFIVFYAFY